MSSFETIIITGCGDCPWGKMHARYRDKPGPPRDCNLHYPMSRAFTEEEQAIRPLVPPKWCRLRKIPVIYKLEEHVNQFVEAQEELALPTKSEPGR